MQQRRSNLSENNLSRHEYWKAHSEAWLSSGLSQMSYCAKEGINHGTFCYWRNRIKKIDSNAINPAQFLEVNKPSPTSASQQPAIQLMLPNGVRLEVSSTTNRELLREVLSFAGTL